MANLPQVGLEAVIANLPGFDAGAKAITNAYDAIEKKAGNVQRATGIMGGAFSSLTSPISNAASQFVSLGNNVIKFGAIAGGVALAGTAALGAGIAALGASALGEIAKFERMELSIQNLVAREIAGGKLIEQSRTGRIQLTEKESNELEKLKGNIDNEVNDRTVLSARIEEQKEKIRQLTDQYGDQGLVVIKERAELQGMQLDLEDLNGEITTHQGRIDELTGKQGQLITTLEKVRVGQMNMTEAMELATPRAKELIQWIQLLAIQSPFTSEGIQAAFQTALAYGFTTEAAQRLTKAEVDFTAATGKSAQSADLIALALGQMQSRGKVTAQELRQLSEQGIGTNRILEDMGFNLDDVSNGLVDADTFIEAVIKDMEIFSGAALQQATTFSGLISSLQELKSIALREFFTGTFQAIRPYLAEFVDFLTKAALKTGDIRKLGDALAQSVGGAMRQIADIVSTFQTRGLAGVFAAAGFTGFFKFRDAMADLFNLIVSNLPNLDNFSSIFDDLAKQVFPTLAKGLQFVIDHFEEFKGALIGVGTLLASASFAAIIARLLSLLSPVNLLIAGVSLLGAAWAGNWGGIQDIVLPIVDRITTAIDKVKGAFDRFGVRGATVSILGQLGLDPTQIAGTMSVVDTVIGIIDRVQQAFQAFQSGVGLFDTSAGSFSSQGILSILGIPPDIQQVAQGLIETNLGMVISGIGSFVTDAWTTHVQPQLDQWSTLFFSWVAAIYPQIPTILTGVTSSIAQWLTDNWPVISASLLEWSTKFWDWVGTATEGLATAMNALAVALLAWATSPEAQTSMGEIGKNVGNAITTAIKLLFESGEGTNSVIVTLGSALLNGVTAIGGTLIILGGELVAGILSGILEGFGINLQPTTFSELSKVLTGIGKNIKTIAETLGKNILLNVLNGLLNTIEKVNKFFTDGVKGWQDIVTQTDWVKLGASIIDGVLKGIADNVSKVYEKLKKMGIEALKQAGQAIGWNSPAAEFVPLGASIPEGIALGIDSASALVSDAMQGIFPGNFDKLLGIDRNLTDPLRIAGAAFDDLEKHLDKTIGKGKTGFALTNIKKAIKENISQILTSLDPTKTIDEIAAHAVPNWEKVGIKLQNVGDVFWNSFKGNAKEAVATLQDMFIEAGRTAISIGQRLTGVIGGAVEILNTRIERLQQIVAQGGGEFEGKVIDTVKAQELLNQALLDQAAIQDDILKTKEQESKLAFLQQQLDLFNTIKEAGLDIGQVLGGLKLGLDASIPDLIAATNKVIEAMINQVNTDLGNISSVGAALGNALTSGVTGSLGIASPSKVMQGLADNTMSSFMNRMLSWGPAIAGAAGSAIAGPTMVAAPALASVGAGSQTTINANFGGNSISSGMDEAQFDSMVLRSIQRLMR